MQAGGSVVRALLLIAAVQAPQTPQSPPPTGLILGRVVDAASGRPVASAVVTLQGAPGAPRAMTNGGGQFVFRNLAKGRFGLTATKSGYVEGAYGRRSPGGTTSYVAVDEGQRVGDIMIAMWKHAVISGSVSDEAGEPMIAVAVRLFKRSYTAGHPRFVPAGSANTDDRGFYRLGGLTPGNYVVGFLSREVSLPIETAELVIPGPSSDPRAREIVQQRSALGIFSSAPGNGATVQVGSLVRSIDQTGAVPPMSDDAAAPVFVYPTVFYPNAPGATRAAVVTLTSGQERDGIDLSLHPARAAHLAGSVIGPDGPVPNLSLHLASTDADTEIEAAATMTDGSGNFVLPAVTAGDYMLSAARVPRPPAPPQQNTVTTMIQVGGSMSGMTSSVGANPTPPPIPDDPAFYAKMTVTVANTGTDNVVVVLQHGGRVSGHLEFDGTADRPDATALSRMPIMLERADNATMFSSSNFGGTNTAPPGRVDETGAFKTYGQPPGKYLLRVGGVPDGWTLKSAVAQGHDISDTPFDLGTGDLTNVVITFTDRPSKLTGVAHTKDGNPDPDGLVIVFPVEPARWADFGLNPRRLRNARPGADGTYTFTGLPAGDYYVMSIGADSTDSWQNPAALADLARSATQIRIADGDTRTQDLVRTGGL